MRKFPILLLLITFLFGNTVSVFPEEGLLSEGRLITLEDALKRAFLQSDQVKLAQTKIEKEEAFREYARKAGYPLLKTSLSASVVTEKRPGVIYWTNEVSLPLVDGGKRKSQIKLHTLKKDEYKLGLASEKASLRYQTKEVYIRVLSEKELILLSEEWVRESKKLYQSFKTLYAKELATRKEFYHAEALYKSARYELLKHKEALDYGLSLLRDLLSLNEYEQIELEPLGEIKRAEFVGSEFLKNPVYEAMRLRVKEKVEESKGVRSNLLPQIALSNRYRIAKDSFLDQNRFEFGVEGAWNVWDFGATRELLKAKELERKETELEGKLKTREFEEKVRELIFRLRTTWAKIESEKANLREKKELYENNKTRLIANELGRLQVFDSYLEYVKARAECIVFEANYRLTEAKLFELKGEEE